MSPADPYRPSILDRPAPEPLMTEAELAEYLARCRKAFAELDRIEDIHEWARAVTDLQLLRDQQWARDVWAKVDQDDETHDHYRAKASQDR